MGTENVQNWEKLHLFTFLDIINAQFELRRYSNQNGRWVAQIQNCEVKEGAILSGSYGNGKTPTEAIKDYIRQIRNKDIVLNAMSEFRKEYRVPLNIYYD